MATPPDDCEALFGKLILFLQQRSDFIDRFLSQYPLWHSSRKEATRKLEQVASDVDRWVMEMDKTKVACDKVAIGGAITAGIGILTLPFGGAALIGAGAAVAAGGAAGTAMVSIFKMGLTLERLREVDVILRQDRYETESIASCVSNIQKASNEIQHILLKLRMGTIDTKLDNIDAVEFPGYMVLIESLGTDVLISIAMLCADMDASYEILSFCYTITDKQLPEHYYHEELSSRPLNRYKIFRKLKDNGGGSIKLSPIVAGLPALAILTVTFAFLTWRQLTAQTAKTVAIEAEEEAIMAAEEEIIVEATTEAAESTALDFEVILAEVFVAAIAGGLCVFDLVSTLKEMREGSRVARELRDVVSKLRNSTENAEKVQVKVKSYKRVKQMQETEEEEEEKKKKKKTYLMSAVCVSTFNVKGTVQNDQYKKFLEKVFAKLPCTLHHIQECTWSSYKQWLGVKQDILPRGYIMTINNLGNREVGIAYNPFMLDMKDKKDDASPPLSDRVHCCKFSTNFTFEVVMENGKLVSCKQSDKSLEFLSFSFHGHYKISNSVKTSQINQLMDYVKQCCRKEKLPAIIGGDFNYDIRWMDLGSEVDVYGGTSDENSSIDFLCIVCGEEFETRMSMKPFVGYIDISKDAPPELQGKITNHVPYFGTFMLEKEVSEDSAGGQGSTCTFM